jgi:hypothetical protein
MSNSLWSPPIQYYDTLYVPHNLLALSPPSPAAERGLAASNSSISLLYVARISACSAAKCVRHIIQPRTHAMPVRCQAPTCQCTTQLQIPRGGGSRAHRARQVPQSPVCAVNTHTHTHRLCTPSPLDLACLDKGPHVFGIQTFNHGALHSFHAHRVHRVNPPLVVNEKQRRKGCDGRT